MKCFNYTIVVIILSIIVASCQYKEIGDARFEEQKIYIPAAVYGEYKLSDSALIQYVPTTGKQKRYNISADGTKFIVPLSVFRSGINKEGDVNVSITANADTVNQLINAGSYTAWTPLPVAQYNLPSNVQIKSGSDLATFELSINRNFLTADPLKKYLFAVTINTSDKQVNSKYKTALILIDAALAK